MAASDPQVQVPHSESILDRAWQLLLLVALTAVVGCDRTPAGSARVEVATVSVSPPSAVLEEDSTHQFQALIRDARGNPLPDRELLWSSSDESVARVSASGMVTAHAPGAARIVATAEGKEGSAEVSVRLRPVATVRVSPPAAEVQTRGTLQLQAELFDARGRPLAEREIRWESGNAAVATVDPDGRVAARAPGVASILAISEGQRDSAAITVTPGDPALLVKLGGDGQRAPVGTMLADSLVVRVTDAFGNPVSGEPVSWAVSHEGSASPPTVTSDAQGLARTRWTLGGAAGEQSATATVAGVDPVGFSAFALRAPTVATLAATSVTPAGAVMRGSASPHGLPTTAWFEWSTSSALEGHASSPALQAGSGLAPVAVSHTLGELAPSTTYHFRIVAASEAGVSRGEVRSFTTEPAPPPPPPTVRIVTFGDSNTDSGYQGRNSTVRARSYVSIMPERLAPSDPNSPFQLAGKIEALWTAARGTPIVAVNHGIGSTTTGGGAGGGSNRTSAGAPNARTAVNGVTRFEAEALGIGYPWHGGEPVNGSFPNGPVARVKAFTPGERDFLYLSMGTNDAGAQLSAAQTLANLEWMIERWIAAGRRPDHLILTTLPPRTQGNGAAIPQINDGIRALALDRGVHLIDLAFHTSADDGVSWRSSQLHVGDGVHYAESVRDWLAARIIEHMGERIPD